MRDSTRYLSTIPAKFACQLSILFLLILAFLRLVESRAAAYGPIHDDLEYYVLLLALLPSTAGLMAMLENYTIMRMSESSLMRYLERVRMARA